MLEENLEQPIETDLGSKGFGKFKDAESLLKAYNNLQAEFTKKSQKLASLESENEKTQFELIKTISYSKYLDVHKNSLGQRK